MGSNVAGLSLGLLRSPADFDNSDYAGTFYSSPTSVGIEGRHRSYRSYLGANANPVYNNPSWTLNRQKNSTTVNRLITALQMDINPTEWLSFITRAGIDHYNDRRTTYSAPNSANSDGNANVAGLYGEDVIGETQFNFDFIGRANKKFGDDLDVTVFGGFNFNNRRYDVLSAQMVGFTLPNAPSNFGNASSTENSNPSNYTETIRTAAVYASADLAFKDMVFANFTGRAESSSTFGPDATRTFFFPSTSIAWQFSQLGSLKENEVLSFGKIRLAYGVVGVQPSPYRQLTAYIPAAFVETWGPSLDAQYYGGGFMRSDVQGNSIVRPERKSEFEIGTDLRFFEDKLRASFTYFSNETKDALFNVPVAASTGYTARYDNAATLQNKGVELELGYDIIKKDDLVVSLNMNWTRYRNKVVSLKGTESLFLAGFTGTSSRAVEGQPLGVLWGGRYDRDETGKMILDDNGFPTVSSSEGVIGDPNPNWRAGMGANVSYKGLNFSFLFERQDGGSMWNGTYGVLNYFGTAADVSNEVTATADIKDYNGAIIPAGTTFRGAIKDFGAGPVALTQAWYTTTGGGFGPLAEQFIFDASWTRLRKVTIGYTLKSKGFRDATKLSALDISFSGRNLALWTNWKGIDPETNLTGASNGRGLEYFNNPNTRSYLFSLRITY